MLSSPIGYSLFCPPCLASWPIMAGEEEEEEATLEDRGQARQAALPADEEAAAGDGARGRRGAGILPAGGGEQGLRDSMRLMEVLTRSFQPPATVRKFSSSHVYLFRNSQPDADDSSEEELDVMELRPRGKEQHHHTAVREKVGDVMLLEREVGRDDSLNKLALQYGCKVADIKRINNFIQEQDLYALKSIKIPIKVHGILTEGSEELQLPRRTDPLSSGPPGASGRSLTSEADQQIDQYFKGIDQTIEQVTQIEMSPGTACGTGTPPSCSPSGKKETSNGADCGIQWWNAVLVMLLVGIVLPVFYVVYFKTQELEVAPTTSNASLVLNSSLHRGGMGVGGHSVEDPGAFIPSGG